MAQTVGEQLKQARLARGLTLEQAAQTTRIRRHYLEALERDDRGTLPSPVQGRGFLRLYAGYLDLPTEPLVALWEGRPLPEPPAPAPATTAPSAAEASEGDPAAQLPLSASEEQAANPPLPSSTFPPEVDEVSVEEVETEAAVVIPPGGSQTIFKEIGQSLRKQREALSLSLPDIERYTRLRQHYLRAMETGRLDELPSMVQGRGMLSNYATFLNLDHETILLRYAEGLQLRRLERMPAPQTGLFSGQRQARGARQASAARRLLTPDLIFGGSLILVLFGFVIWTAARISSIRSEEVQSTLPSVGEVLLLTPSATLDLALITQLPAAGTPIAGEGEVTGPTQSLPEFTDAGVPVSTLAPINSDPLQVYIIARQRTFLRVLVDGEIRFNGRVVPGNAYPYSGKESIEFITGNAAAFQVFFNQADLGPLGQSGEVLRMTFTQSGVVTPTPLPTSTPAPTIAITATIGPSPTVATPTVTPLIP